MGAALLAVVDDPDCSEVVKAEAAITLGMVFDREAADAQALRESFEAALDPVWLAALREDVAGA